jgi:hypothetical protein
MAAEPEWGERTIRRHSVTVQTTGRTPGRQADIGQRRDGGAACEHTSYAFFPRIADAFTKI